MEQQGGKFSVLLHPPEEVPSRVKEWNLIPKYVGDVMSAFFPPVLLEMVIQYISGSDICAEDISNWVKTRRLSLTLVDVCLLHEFPDSRLLRENDQDNKKNDQDNKKNGQTTLIPVHVQSPSSVVIDDGKNLYSYRGTLCTLNRQVFLLTLPSKHYMLPSKREPVVYNDDNHVFIIDMKSHRLRPLDHLQPKNAIWADIRVNADSTWCVVGAGNESCFVHSLVTSTRTSLCLTRDGLGIKDHEAVVDVVAFHPHKPDLLAVAFKRRQHKFSLAFIIRLYRLSTNESGTCQLTPLCETSNVGLFDPESMINFDPAPRTDLVWSKSGRFVSYCAKYTELLDASAGYVQKICASIESFDIELKNRHQRYFRNEDLFAIAKQCVDSPACELERLVLLDDGGRDCNIEYFATPYCMGSYNAKFSELQLFIGNAELLRIKLPLPKRTKNAEFIGWRLSEVKWSVNRDKLYVVLHGLIFPEAKYVLFIIQ